VEKVMPLFETSVQEFSSGIMREVTGRDWQRQLPVLVGKHVRMREVRTGDADSLFAMLTTDEVTRFISPPPTSPEGVERFISWTLHQRGRGSSFCFAVTLQGCDTAVGVIQVRQLDSNFEMAEWGFALGSPFWGTGVFEEAAELVLNFVFNTLGVHRLEARAAVRNGRGNGALLKMGAVKEGVLRRSLLRNGQFFDQVLYSILVEDWQERAIAAHCVKSIHVH
jgi:[ribosomal protein S5]-alanine N-acetyltransferase